jgi:hypothetical protein
MPHPVVYPGNFDALLKEWEDKAKQVYKEQGKDGLKHLMIANGQCARLPQELTSVGYTGRWQRGDRVIDVARALKPGTVIANFKLIDGSLMCTDTTLRYSWAQTRTVEVSPPAFSCSISGGVKPRSGPARALCMYGLRRLLRQSSHAIRPKTSTWFSFPSYETNSHRSIRPVLFRRPCGRVSLSSNLPR